MAIYIRTDKSLMLACALLIIAFLFICSINAGAANSGKGSPSAGTQTFVTYKYVDPMTNMQVFSLLIPKGWKVNGGVTWSADPALPAKRWNSLQDTAMHGPMTSANIS